MIIPNSGDERRRIREKVMVQEGLDIWRQKKEKQWYEKKTEQKELKELLKEYAPWGKPGCGAPNQDTIRKTKMGQDFENNKGGMVMMGRPGGGAPHRTRSGHLNVLYKADPILRFQFHDHTRRTVDNELRYRVAAPEQLAYKQQLDKMVIDRRRLRAEELRRAGEIERKLGWSNEKALKQLDVLSSKQTEIKKGQKSGQTHSKQLQIEQQEKQKEPKKETANLEKEPVIKSQIVEKLTGGVELVPLLTRRRDLAERHPLSTTDVTRYTKIKPGVSQEACIEYIETLSQQMKTKQQHLQLARQEELESCKRHFDTWQRFWGRPGHGAPRAVNVMSNLDVLLRQIPCK